MQPPLSAGAVVYAKDLKRVSRFYAELVGLRVVREEPDHVVLQSPVFQLVIVAVAPHIAERITIASPPARRENTPIKLWLAVPSLAQARGLAAQLGGELNASEREWESPGWRVCDGHDPEGNVIQLREPVPAPKDA